MPPKVQRDRLLNGSRGRRAPYPPQWALVRALGGLRARFWLSSCGAAGLQPNHQGYRSSRRYSLVRILRQSRRGHAIRIGIGPKNPRREEQVQLSLARLPTRAPEQATDQRQVGEKGHPALRHITLVIAQTT